MFYYSNTYLKMANGLISKKKITITVGLSMPSSVFSVHVFCAHNNSYSLLNGIVWKLLKAVSNSCCFCVLSVNFHIHAREKEVKTGRDIEIERD